MDPTGNITALVESPVDICDQPYAASQIMERHREVEQVGFVHFEDPSGLSLRMAGGEFCGNASMSAAALYLMNKGSSSEKTVTLSLKVSGAEKPVRIELEKNGSESFAAGVCMPEASAIEDRPIVYEDISDSLPFVRMKGISHLIIEPSSPFFALKKEPERAVDAIRRICSALEAGCLGFMFLEETEGQMSLTPLVIVPASGTVFWENSCASGTSAAGMYLAAKNGCSVNLSFKEPGGVLRAASDPQGETVLYGTVKRIKQS